MLKIAEIILQQMGGAGRLKAMLGTKKFMIDTNDDLLFDFKMCKKAKLVRIHLNGMDTYDITFYKVRKFERTVSAEFNGVYNDQLKETFEGFTGLYLTL